MIPIALVYLLGADARLQTAVFPKLPMRSQFAGDHQLRRYHRVGGLSFPAASGALSSGWDEESASGDCGGRDIAGAGGIFLRSILRISSGLETPKIESARPILLKIPLDI
ncbi:MAG: hypothetical protein ACYCPM_03540 [Acidobacteriaceae bacterium]